jgi:hypothetical protein
MVACWLSTNMSSCLSCSPSARLPEILRITHLLVIDLTNHHATAHAGLIGLTAWVYLRHDHTLSATVAKPLS